ncbi:MFS transporter [Streptococcus loxodontisalivarius]
MLNSNAKIIFLNRFLSLIIEYGYAIALSIIFSKISVDYVLGLWLAKFMGGLLANIGHTFLVKITNKKYVLIGIELLKACCLALIYIWMESIFVFALIVLTEVLTTYFNSLLSSVISLIVTKENLRRFNSIYTMIGSASYFLAPMIVGIWSVLDLGGLFLIYSLLTVLATLMLFRLDALIIKNDNDIEPLNEKHFGVINKKTIIINMVVITLLLQSVGVLYDAYEVIFLTQNVGISSQAYSFSLSFLAIVFLVTSAILSLKKWANYSPIKGYILGTLIYAGYLVIFPLVPNLLGVLISYIFLAIGQTILGISQSVYLQERMEPHELNSLYLKMEVFNDILTGSIVFFSGMLVKISIQISLIYMIYAFIMLIIALGIYFTMKKQIVK